jgi:hypothetical protein
MAHDLDQPTLGPHGGRRTRGQRNGTTLQRGNSRAYFLARLRREGYDDAVEAIEMHRISAFSVAVQLGWVRRRKTLTGENSHQAKRRRHRFDVKAIIG